MARQPPPWTTVATKVSDLIWALSMVSGSAGQRASSGLANTMVSALVAPKGALEPSEAELEQAASRPVSQRARERRGSFMLGRSCLLNRGSEPPVTSGAAGRRRTVRL